MRQASNPSRIVVCFMVISEGWMNWPDQPKTADSNAVVKKLANH